MSRPQFSLKMLLWLTVVVAAFLGGARFERRIAGRRADRETEVMAALAEKTEFQFTDQPLQDVADYFQERHHIIIVLDAKAISEAGASTDAPITRNIKGITLRSALKQLLRELDLTFVIQNGVLKITSLTEAENIQETGSMPSAPGTRF